jgi:hypothetical protein
VAEDITGLRISDYRKRELPDGQFCAIRLNADVQAHRRANIPFNFISFNVDGSNFLAAENGQMVKNQADIRGWFMEEVEVEITLSDPSFTLTTDSPSTTMGSSSTSSSTGLSFDEGAGTFGPTPTMNVGVGLTIGWSFSRSLSDIAIVNKSTNNRVSHKYRLASSRGGSYSSPQDLLDRSPAGVVQGVPLFEIPDIAISNMPIITQGIFQGPQTNKDLDVQFIVRGRLRKIEKTFQVFTVQVETAEGTVIEAFKITVPLSRREAWHT